VDIDTKKSVVGALLVSRERVALLVAKSKHEVTLQPVHKLKQHNYKEGAIQDSTHRRPLEIDTHSSFTPSSSTEVKAMSATETTKPRFPDLNFIKPIEVAKYSRYKPNNVKFKPEHVVAAQGAYQAGGAKGDARQQLP
jgi:hypothetical protein